MILWYAHVQTLAVVVFFFSFSFSFVAFVISISSLFFSPSLICGLILIFFFLSLQLRTQITLVFVLVVIINALTCRTYPTQLYVYTFILFLKYSSSLSLNVISLFTL